MATLVVAALVVAWIILPRLTSGSSPETPQVSSAPDPADQLLAEGYASEPSTSTLPDAAIDAEEPI